MSGVLLALRQENAFGLGPRSLTESLGSLGAIIVSGSEKRTKKMCFICFTYLSTSTMQSLEISRMQILEISRHSIIKVDE